MEWIQSLNKAIDYIEDNLLQDITCVEVANHICISTFHFHRTFNMLTNITISEYIRNRRLSLAGQELTKENVKVIDVAFKYGYETPESFSKAFSRFHGITPTQAKKEGAVLKSFNRLVIKIKLEGGTTMDYKIVKKDVFKVVVKTKLFSHENCTTAIPAFWTEYFSSGLNEKICGMIGICAQEKTGCKEFKYGIGCIDNDATTIPEDFEVLEIPAYTWAIFKCVGPMPNAIQDMWERIYSEWLPQAEYELISDYDIEVYTEGNSQSQNYNSEIWIPVKSL